jgi:hypothetical protein
MRFVLVVTDPSEMSQHQASGWKKRYNSKDNIR